MRRMCLTGCVHSLLLLEITICALCSIYSRMCILEYTVFSYFIIIISIVITVRRGGGQSSIKDFRLESFIDPRSIYRSQCTSLYILYYYNNIILYTHTLAPSLVIFNRIAAYIIVVAINLAVTVEIVRVHYIIYLSRYWLLWFHILFHSNVILY